jgi:hypothetical protein
MDTVETRTKFPSLPIKIVKPCGCLEGGFLAECFKMVHYCPIFSFADRRWPKREPTCRALCSPHFLVSQTLRVTTDGPRKPASRSEPPVFELAVK